MTVRELIARLQTFDPDLVVCLADWNEGYCEPNEEAAEQIEKMEGRYYPKGVQYWPQGDIRDPKIGPFLRLG